MKKIKYVVVDMFSGYSKNETIVIFPEFIEHRAMAKSLVDDEDDILSAGFCYLPDELGNKAQCYGESISLDKKSRPNKDTLLLRLMIDGDLC